MLGKRRESTVLVRLNGELVPATTDGIASIATRSRARLTDVSLGALAATALAGALIFVSQFLGAGHDFGAGPNDMELAGGQWQEFTLVLLAISLFIVAVTEAFFVSIGRPTPGKRDKQLLIVSAVDQRPPDFTDCIIRSLIPVGVWSVGPALAIAFGMSWPLLAGPAIGTCLCALVHLPAIAHSAHQGPHDMAARTIVVKYQLLDETA